MAWSYLPTQMRYAETLAGLCLLLILCVTIFAGYMHWDALLVAVLVRGEPIMPRLAQVAVVAGLYKAMFYFMNICRRGFPMVTSVAERFGDPRGFDGCTAIVTGCNTGIGLVVAKKLFAAGATVIMACRTESKAMQARDGIISECKSSATISAAGLNDEELRRRLLFVKLDLTSIQQTKECVEEIKDLFRSRRISGIHYLVNNAGAFFPVFEHVGDSKSSEPEQVGQNKFEKNLYVNHLAPVVLTEGILPLMVETMKHGNGNSTEPPFPPGGRIINVASIAHTTINTPEGRLTDSRGIPSYTDYLKRCHHPEVSERDKLVGSPYQLYGLSKVCNILYAKHLQKRIDNYNATKKLSSEKIPIVACSLHPGFIMTDVFRRLPASTQRLMNFFLGSTVCKTIDEGAETTLTCIAKWGVEGGSYFVDNFFCPNAQAWGDENSYQDEEKSKQFEKELSGVIDDFTFGALEIKPVVLSC